MRKILAIAIMAILAVGLFVSCDTDAIEGIFEDIVPTYTVTFDMQEHGEQIAPLTKVPAGSKITAPEAPTEDTFTFDGWYKDPEFANAWDFDVDTVNGDTTLYAKWTSNCIAAGTKITMADGSSKLVEELETGDVIRTLDHKTGLVSSSSVCFIMKSEDAKGAFTLHFENGIDVTVIEEHGFYDNDLNKYVFINADNAKDYVGHHFFNGDLMRQMELVGCENLSGKVDAYAVVTSKHLNHMAEGMLSISDGSIKLFANLFEYGSDMKFDEAKQAQDIATYGLMEKEAFTKYRGFEEDDYENYNLQYVSIMIGKGLVTWEEIEVFYNLCADYLDIE